MKKPVSPPRRALQFLRWFCHPDLLPEIEGDLQELFQRWVKEHGERNARWLYVWQVLTFFRPFAIRKERPVYNLNSTDMFGNYFKIAWRNTYRNKAFSAINILGMTLGLASSLIIFLWIQDEYNIDHFHANGDQLYQVYLRSYNGGQVEAGYNTPAPLPEELKNVIPEIKYASGFAKGLRLARPGEILETFQVGDTIQKMHGSRAGVDFFQMFSYPLLHGTPETALAGPNSIAISRKMANLFFGNPEAAFGKTMAFSSESDKREVVVMAVFEDIPTASSDQFDYLLNWDYWVQHDEFKKTWGHFGTLTYLQLQAGTDPDLVEAKIKDFLDNYLEIPEGMDIRFELGLQPFGDQYLYANFENGKPSGGRIEYVRLLSGVAIFILLIACINFMNLTTAHSLKRGKEVGVRKVMGAVRASLINQFMGEAWLLTLLAMVAAVLLLSYALPWFNEMTGKQITLPLGSLPFAGTLLGLLVVVGFVAGSYPALFLSALHPARVLKGTLNFSAGATSFRKGLIVFQFALSILLIIATIVVTRQTEFIQNKHLGYNRENVLYLPLEGALVDNYLTFKKEASQMPGIKLVDRSSQTPHQMGLSGQFVQWEGMDASSHVNFTPSSVGYDYVKLMGMKIVEGRDFSQAFPTDTSSFLVSALAVRQMGLKDPVGSMITVFGKTGPIVGVVNDFHTQSLHQAIRPTVLDIKEHLNFGTILVRTEPGKTKEALASLEEVSKRLNPDYPFTYSFLDDEYQKLYRSEQVVTKLSNAFGFLAIFISCLGLLGLAMFSAEQRTKEIGIRKVLGASVSSIITLFAKDFLRLVGLSFIIASPIAWFAMHRWLQGFAYQTDLAWWIFVIAGVLALVIALLTISFQAIKAALANPVDSLRNE